MGYDHFWSWPVFVGSCPIYIALYSLQSTAVYLTLRLSMAAWDPSIDPIATILSCFWCKKNDTLGLYILHYQLLLRLDVCFRVDKFIFLETNQRVVFWCFGTLHDEQASNARPFVPCSALCTSINVVSCNYTTGIYACVFFCARASSSYFSHATSIYILKIKIKNKKYQVYINSYIGRYHMIPGAIIFLRSTASVWFLDSSHMAHAHDTHTTCNAYVHIISFI